MINTEHQILLKETGGTESNKEILQHLDIFA